jgi:tetratricopeptide (TPR) repeat protein
MMAFRLRPHLLLLGCVAALLSGCLPPRNPFHKVAGSETVEEDSLAQARRMDRIETLIEQGAYAEARATLTEAIEAGFEHPRAFYLQGRADHEEERYQSAAAWFDKAIALAPTWPEPRLALAQTFMDEGRFAAADSVFADIDTLFDWHPAGPYGRGFVAHGRGEDDDAVRWLEISLERSSTYIPAMRLRADIAHKRGEDRLQRLLMERYLVLQPEEPVAHIRLAELDAKDGLLESALRGYQRAWALQRDPSTARALADLLRRLGRPEEAATYSNAPGVR